MQRYSVSTGEELESKGGVKGEGQGSKSSPLGEGGCRPTVDISGVDLGRWGVWR